MFGVVLLTACPPMPVDPPPALADLLAFPVCREVARLNRDATATHTQRVLGQLPSDVRRWAWEFRQEAVYAAWASLVGALDDEADEAVRMASLRSLRTRIGPAAYYAGSMPAPLPAYGVFHPLKP